MEMTLEQKRAMAMASARMRAASASGGNTFSEFEGMDKAIHEKGRGAFDKLLGLTGERYQTWPERAVREVAGLPKELVDAAKSAPAGSQELTENLVGPAAKTAMVASPRPALVKRSTETLPTAEEIKRAGSQGFDALRKSDSAIDPKAVSGRAVDWRSSLEQRGFSPRNSPETFAILDELAAGGPAGSTFTIPNAHAVRETLGKAAQQFTNPREQAAASSAIKYLDDYLGNIPERDLLAGDPRASAKVLSDAIKNYASAKKSEQVTDSLEVADLRAAAANSGKNQGNRERQALASILASDKKSSGFRDDELAQMERVVRGTVPGNKARDLANLLGSGGGLGKSGLSLLAAAGAGAAGGMEAGIAAGVGIPLAGSLFRKGAEASTKRQARILDEMVRARSPMAEKLADDAPEISSIDKARAARLAKALMLLELQPQQ